MRQGDFILVHKLPITNNPGRNRVVLFQNPLPNDQEQQTLFLSRCMGMPGDTILVHQDGYLINGKKLPSSPRALQSYRVDKSKAADLLRVMQKEEIPVRSWQENTGYFTLILTTFEAYSICEELPELLPTEFQQEAFLSYQLIVPKKGIAYRLTPDNLPLCLAAIQQETGNRAAIRDNKLFLDDVETDFYFFEQDYFWMLSDNIPESVDSRHLGFIPRKQVVGNVWICWFSKEIKRIFKSVN